MFEILGNVLRFWEVFCDTGKCFAIAGNCFGTLGRAVLKVMWGVGWGSQANDRKNTLNDGFVMPFVHVRYFLTVQTIFLLFISRCTNFSIAFSSFLAFLLSFIARSSYGPPLEARSLLRLRLRRKW